MHSFSSSKEINVKAFLKKNQEKSEQLYFIPLLDLLKPQMHFVLKITYFKVYLISLRWVKNKTVLDI